MTNVHPLDALTFPLQGQQLIEASAGTGKTYTITALYLRLLLGQGDISDKPLGPEQILVVTFTEAVSVKVTLSICYQSFSNVSIALAAA